MLKWLFWLTILLVFWGISRSRSRHVAQRSSSKQVGNGLVACVHCQLHVPEAEAVLHDGHRFCCEQHYRLWQQSAR